MLILQIVFLSFITWIGGFPTGSIDAEIDNEESRKILGSSVVTSVSVILNSNNGTKIIDAVGKPVPKPPTGTYVASPINLLNPDRYEFFTFDDNGELVKRLMTLEEIQSIIANGDGEDINYNSGSYLPEKKVNDVVSNVQNVLKEQIESHKNTSDLIPILDTPDVSSTWSMILPAIFNNHADGIVAEKPEIAVTADTIMIEMVPEKEPEGIMEAIEKVTTTTVRSTSVTPQSTTAAFATTPIRMSSSTIFIPSTTTPTTPSTPSPTTTPIPVTTTYAITTPLLVSSSSTPMPEKLSTEQYVGEFKPVTQQSVPSIVEEEMNQTEPPSNKDTNVMTVAVISDTKFDTVNLPTGEDSPMVSILPVEEKIPLTTTESIESITEIKASSSFSPVIDLENVETTTVAPLLATVAPTMESEESKETAAGELMTTTMKPVKVQAYAPVSEPIQLPIYLVQNQTSSSTPEVENIKNKPEATTDLPAVIIVKEVEAVATLANLEQEITTVKTALEDEKLPEINSEMLASEKKPQGTVGSELDVVNVEKEEEGSDVEDSEATEVKVPEIMTIQAEMNTSAESLSEVIQTAASNTLGQSTTPILLIIQENPTTTERLTPQQESEATTERVPERSTPKIISTTQNVVKQTDKPSTIKIIYLTEKTVANILSSTTQSSVTTPKPVATVIPEEISTISKLIATTEAPNTVKIVPLTEKLLTTISNVASSTEGLPITTVKKDQTIQVNTEEILEDKAEFTTEAQNSAYSKTVTENLNQLLLSSTNIYEINTQLAGVTIAVDPEVIYDANELNAEDERFDSDLTTEAFTTENSLASSIEQLISQTVNDANIEEEIINLNSNQKVQDVLAEMESKPMDNIQKEAATIGSMLVDEEREEDSKEGDNSESDESLKLSEAVSSVLSQIYSQGIATTVQNVDLAEMTTAKDVEAPEMIKIAEVTERLSSDKDVNSDSEETIEEDANFKDNNKGEIAKNDTSSEENITAESSQTVITEISSNDNDFVNKEVTLEEVLSLSQSNEDVLPELEKNKTADTPVSNPTVNIPSKDDPKTPEDSPIIRVTPEKVEVTKRPEVIAENVDNNYEDLVKIDVIQPAFGEKISEDDNQSPETKIKEEEMNFNKDILGDDDNKKSPEQIETTPSSVTQSAVPDLTINEGLNKDEKSSESQPVKKIKIDDQSEVEDVKKTPSESTSSAIKDMPVREMPETSTLVHSQVFSSAVPERIEDQNLGVSSTVSPVIIKTESVENNKEDAKNTSWTLVSIIAPHSNMSSPVLAIPEQKPIVPVVPMTTTASPVKLSQQNLPGFGLEDTTSKLDTDIYQFVELCNELSFGFWNAVTHGISTARSVFVSPFAATSLLAMVFLGARGATSGEMNEILKLDDMVTFNPHLIFKNVSESIGATRNSGVAISVIARELYSDRNRGKLLSFYKERAKQFYDGHVEEVNFKEIGDVIRRRTNLIVKKNSGGKIGEYLKDNSITMRPPLAGISASIFQTDCSSASTDGRDGEIHFVVLPSIRQRRLVPVPAVVFRSGFLAGYDPTLDATAAAIGTQEQIVSTILIIPGQQGIAAPGDGLARLEKQLSESVFKKGAWTRLLRTLIPRPGLELQIPRFSHKSVINATIALQRMGLKDLFNYGKADLRGLNGAAHELHLSDILQLNNFATCGESPINSEQHHSEIYPATSRRPYRRTKKLGHYVPDSVFGDISDEPRDYQRAFHDPLHDPTLLSLPLPLRPRQARIPDAPRLRFDRPFLFYVRHNPTGLILHMGRFNPRLLP